ncbi:MAG: fructose-6-phosphate aldolase [Deinococcaceae bacterium]
MKLFIDTANTDEIREICSWGVLSGVTTNPSLVAASGRSFHEVVVEICNIVSGDVSAEVIALDANGMIQEGLELANLHDRVVIKLPITAAGLTACRVLSDQGIRTNLTLCFSVNQALLVSAAGATYVSPFVGRLDDIGTDGVELIRQIAQAYTITGAKTQVLAASIRHPMHVTQVALAGAHVATLPYKVFQHMIKHPLTQAGLDQFMLDWNKVLRS